MEIHIDMKYGSLEKEIYYPHHCFWEVKDGTNALFWDETWQQIPPFHHNMEILSNGCEWNFQFLLPSSPDHGFMLHLS